MALTIKQVQNAKAGRHSDGNGLYLLVKPSGSKSWVLRVQHRGRCQDFGLGSVAQTADPAADPMMTSPAPVEDDDDFPWGILGLLGLAGLMGLKKRDRDDDVRRTGTGTNNR